MPARLRAALPLVAVAVASGAFAFANHSTGDYPVDAGPAIDALLAGKLGHAASSSSIMGAFAVFVRLPFAALAKVTGGGELAVYRLGCLPCLFALGLVGLALSREMIRRGLPSTTAGAAGALCLVNPLTWEALRLGHPEELLCTALVVGAMLYAIRGRPLAAGLALGLALATKQWAVIAILPVLVVVPGRRLRVVLVAGALAAVLTLPIVIGNLNGFYGANRQAGWSGERVYSYNAIWPFAPTEDRVIEVAGMTKVVTVRTIPPAVAHLLHPLIVLLALPLTAAWMLRRRREPEDALALLALLFLLRCLIDPVDNAYYHLPFAVSLIAWEGLSRRTLPLFGLLTSLAVWFAIAKATMIDELALRNAAYLAATVPFGVWLALRLYAGRRAPGRRAVRTVPAGAPT